MGGDLFVIHKAEKASKWIDTIAILLEKGSVGPKDTESLIWKLVFADAPFREV